MGFWDVVASAGPYANNLHLTLGRWLHQHLITQFFSPGQTAAKRLCVCLTCLICSLLKLPKKENEANAGYMLVETAY